MKSSELGAKPMIRRVVGLLLILVAVSGLAMFYLGARGGRDLADNLARNADDVLETADSTLTTVGDSLEQSRQTIRSITLTVGAVQTTTVNLASTVDDTQPLLDELVVLVGQDIPGTIGDVQAAIPNIAQTAKVVDDTLTLLSKLQVEQTIPLVNYKISFGLGVEYDPEIPFDQAVEQVGVGLGPIALTSGNLESELETSKANMAVLHEDLTALAADLDQLNKEVGAFKPLLDEYTTLVDDMQDRVRQGRQRIDDQLSNAKQVITAAAIWLSLSQLLPLYFGLELLLGNRMVHPAGSTVTPADDRSRAGP
jgi:uncharacterized phage infection (PIP) family protein YhgE